MADRLRLLEEERRRQDARRQAELADSERLVQDVKRQQELENERLYQEELRRYIRMIHIHEAESFRVLRVGEVCSYTEES